MLRGTAVPVPRSVFHTGRAQAGPGLKAEYFVNTDFSGKPVLTRIDPQIQFDWNAAAPAPECPARPSPCAGAAR